MKRHRFNWIRKKAARFWGDDFERSNFLKSLEVLTPSLSRNLRLSIGKSIVSQQECWAFSD
ncbi:hypothetical protein SCA6_014401 [Theobroma cacao]